ncbi:MAG: hypothetical protein GF349_01730 [Candidatus Magasanikbacteria bacterium]|nr:hypothetical protein [Candidatus Magasanikbacteria bacterium]
MKEKKSFVKFEAECEKGHKSDIVSIQSPFEIIKYTRCPFCMREFVSVFRKNEDGGFGGGAINKKFVKKTVQN